MAAKKNQFSVCDFRLSQLPPWLRSNAKTSGRDNGIVISTRIRLARNIAGFPFPSRCTAADRKGIREAIRKATQEVWKNNKTGFLDVDKLDSVDIQLLLERQLISKELAEADVLRSVFIASDESFCVMINEEDHIRIHALANGFTLGDVWETVNSVDDQIENQLASVNSYSAVDTQYGYLTACPTNIGTGMRVSIMLHLPGLVITKEMETVFRTLQKDHFAVRGFYGEGTQAFGDFFQISNQITFGKSEAEIIDSIRRVIPQIIDCENQAREYLLSEKPAIIRDRCSRSLGLLQTAYTIDSAESIHHLSNVRLGIHAGIIKDISIETVNSLVLCTQPAHLQKCAGAKLDQSERDIKRAELIRLTLTKK